MTFLSPRVTAFPDFMDENGSHPLRSISPSSSGNGHSSSWGYHHPPRSNYQHHQQGETTPMTTAFKQQTNFYPVQEESCGMESFDDRSWDSCYPRKDSDRHYHSYQPHLQSSTTNTNSGRNTPRCYSPYPQDDQFFSENISYYANENMANNQSNDVMPAYQSYKPNYYKQHHHAPPPPPEDSSVYYYSQQQQQHYQPLRENKSVQRDSFAPTPPRQPLSQRSDGRQPNIISTSTSSPPVPPTKKTDNTASSSPDALQQLDIVCGRGAPKNFHYGNQVFFKELVEEYQTKYFCAKRSDKAMIAMKVLDIIKSRGGRFVRRQKKTAGPRSCSCWEPICDKSAYERVCQELRGCAPDLQRQVMSTLAMRAK